MPLFGSSKKDPAGAPPLAAAPAGDEAPEFEHLAAQMEKLRELYHQTNEQLIAYLVRRESQAAPPAAQAMPPAVNVDLSGLQAKLDGLMEKVDRLASAAAAPAPAPMPAPAPHPPGVNEQALRVLLTPIQKGVEAVERQNVGLSEAVRQMREDLDQRLTELANPPEQPPPEPTVSAGDWERAIMGGELAAQPALAFQRQQFINGILEGNAGACALAGQLLAFQSAPVERLPQLLKDLGEAYYRWQPKTGPGNTSLEEALVRWLKRTCETAGIYNDIELVHPGERFDSSRHVTGGRGVEITEVLGWIVLRDNGKVYTKASVQVR